MSIGTSFGGTICEGLGGGLVWGGESLGWGMRFEISKSHATSTWYHSAWWLSLKMEAGSYCTQISCLPVYLLPRSRTWWSWTLTNPLKLYVPINSSFCKLVQSWCCKQDTDFGQISKRREDLHPRDRKSKKQKKGSQWQAVMSSRGDSHFMNSQNAIGI